MSAWAKLGGNFQHALASAGAGIANASQKFKAEVDLLREDPAQKERRENAPRDRFVCLKRLKESVKELLQHQYATEDESAVQTTPLNEDDPPAAHICAAVERCVFHGLRTLDGEASFWAFMLVMQMHGAAEFQAVVQQVSNVGYLTPVGKSRAWVRAALNSNLVEASFVDFMEHKKVLADFYEDYALMRCPEGSQIMISMVTALSGGWEFCFTIDDIENLDTKRVILGSEATAPPTNPGEDVENPSANSDKRRTWGEFAQTLAVSADKALNPDGLLTYQLSLAQDIAGKAGQKISTASMKLQQEINRNKAHAQKMLAEHRANHRLFRSPLMNVARNPRYSGAVAHLDWRLGVPLLVDGCLRKLEAAAGEPKLWRTQTEAGRMTALQKYAEQGQQKHLHGPGGTNALGDSLGEAGGLHPSATVHEAAALLVAYLTALPAPLLASHREGFLACSQLLALAAVSPLEAEEGGGAAAVITEEAAEAAVAEADAMNEARQTNLRCLVADLPAEASCLLERLLRTLAMLLKPANTETNGLSVAFVARIFAPILLRNQEQASVAAGVDQEDDSAATEGGKELEATEMILREEAAALVHARGELRKRRAVLRKKVEWWAWPALRQRMRPLSLEAEEDVVLLRTIHQELKSALQQLEQLEQLEGGGEEEAGEVASGDGSTKEAAEGGVTEVDLGEVNVTALLESEVWVRCSFTPNDPLADFNSTNSMLPEEHTTRPDGGGRLGAECFLFFLQRYPANARALIGARAGARGAAERARTNSGDSTTSGDSSITSGGSSESTSLANELLSSYPLAVGSARVLQALLQLLKLLPAEDLSVACVDLSVACVESASTDAGVESAASSSASSSTAESDADAPEATEAEGAADAEGKSGLAVSVVQELQALGAAGLDRGGHMLQLASRPWWQLLDDPSAVEGLCAVGLVLLDHHFKEHQRQEETGAVAKTAGSNVATGVAGIDFNHVVDRTRAQIDALITSSTPAPESVEDVWRLWCTLRTRQMEAEAERRMQVQLQQRQGISTSQIDEKSKELGYAQPPEATPPAPVAPSSADHGVAGSMGMDTPPSSDDEGGGGGGIGMSIGMVQEGALGEIERGMEPPVGKLEQQELFAQEQVVNGGGGMNDSGRVGAPVLPPATMLPAASTASAGGAGAEGGEITLLRKRCVRGGEYYMTQLRSPTDTLHQAHGLPGGALEQLEQALPATYQGYDWVRKYSLAKHGACLQTFYQRVQVRGHGQHACALL
jgi:hypothetical protein